MPDAVMLFAAGFGTRMGALTADRPKPLVEVAGRPLIDHALDLARGVQPRRIVANLHYRADQLAAHLAGTEVHLAHEGDEILDTGGGLRAALPILGAETVFTLNTDAVWRGPNPLALLREAWAPQDMEALLLCVPPRRAAGHAGAGDFTIAPDGRAGRGPGAIYTGAQILATPGLRTWEERVFSLNRVWDEMIARGRLYAMLYPGRWCDVGRPEGIALAEAMLGEEDDVRL
ncbi:nucleotidyltransferase family protein [Rhodosalinus halophilus]|uniref:Nucleotidyltransferase family protein n=1 Tax=Rhodosalinus halophilus TaxID=2259333 RepID=A0A365U7R0_9RHOB|nr:nucleotidyltransferase family protein [Rhodosalinus halophilus]RBI84708.1 nucleotidyltransferase family protein [Rhodosalinus halophilus]